TRPGKCSSNWPSRAGIRRLPRALPGRWLKKSAMSTPYARCWVASWVCRPGEQQRVFHYSRLTRPKMTDKQTFPAQHQDQQPGSEQRMQPQPEFISANYRAAGKLEGKVVVVTGA